MEMRKEIYNIDDVMGVDMKSNSVLVDILTPVGSGMKEQVAAIMGLAVKRHKDAPEEIGAFLIGTLSPEALVTYVVEFACDTLVGHLGACHGIELMAVMGRSLRKALVVAIKTEIDESGKSMGQILDEVKAHMDEVMPRYFESEE